MKNLYRLITLVVIPLWTALPVCAQISFESLKLSSAPAYVILGVEPENISRPGSPTEFLVGVQNAIVDGKLTPNFAMEFTPYYWKNPDKDPQRFRPEHFFSTTSPAKTIWKTLTISLATSASDSVVFGRLIPGTAAGFGIRLTLWEGKPNKQIYDNLKRWSDASTMVAITDEILLKLINGGTDMELIEAVKEIPVHSLAEQTLMDEVLAFITAHDQAGARNLAQDEHDAAFTIVNQQLAIIGRKKFPFAKQGFMLEAAAGEAILFQNNDWNRSTRARFAAWLTPSYRWDLSSSTGEEISILDAMGVLRYTFNNTQDSVDVSNYLDIGGKGKYSINKWSLDFEFVYRYATDVDREVTEKNYTYRATSSLEYRFSDRVSFKATYGTTFNGNTATYTAPKDIFVLGGVNVGLFKSGE